MLDSILMLVHWDIESIQLSRNIIKQMNSLIKQHRKERNN